MRTEADRVAFLKDKAETENNAKTAKWLSNNLDIGVLNSGKYYRVINNDVVFVERFG